MKSVIRYFAAFFSAVAVFVFACAVCADRSVPDSLRTVSGVPPTIESNGAYACLSYSESSVSAQCGAGAAYEATLKLFGIIPVKKVSISVEEEKQVCLSGKPFGIKLYTDGVMVVGFEKIKTEGTDICPGSSAGLEVGDIITQINGESVASMAQMLSMVEKSGGREMEFDIVKSDGSRTEKHVSPVYSNDDCCYKAGVWVRDSTSGIGTMTYIEPDSGHFAGLGHGICDTDTGNLMPFGRGETVDVTVTGVTKASDGLPGELHGYFGDSVTGYLTANEECGVFGVTEEISGGRVYSAAMKQEVKEGRAKMLTTVPGEDEPKLYDIMIERINYSGDSPTKNMIIRVTDDRLIRSTGGIVQGMSGSPIIQNGKFVGAATHVFVNDSTKGYAIFAENMLYGNK